MEQSLLIQAQSEFFAAMCRQDPFSELLQAAYQILGWPVLVGDDASNVILQIPNTPIGSVWYDTLLADRHVHPELYVQFQEAMWKVYNPQGAQIQIIPGENDQYPVQVFLTVRVYGTVLSQVVFHVPKAEISTEERSVLELLHQALTAECRKAYRQESLPAKRIQHQMRLLLDNEREPEVLRHHAKGLESALGGDYVVIVSLLEADARKESFQPFYIEQIGKLLPNTLSIPYEGNIVTLCGKLRGSDPPQFDALLEFIKTCSVIAGSTMRFSGNLLQLGTMYQQALLTARLGHIIRPKEFIFEFEALSPLQVFVPAMREFQIKTFLHPSTVAIMEYDEKNGTEYLKTLQAYLVTGKNNRESIRLLSVHQNTLLYRLTKIKDLFGIDFMDGHLTLTLLSNVLLLEVARPDLLPLFDLNEKPLETE